MTPAIKSFATISSLLLILTSSSFAETLKIGSTGTYPPFTNLDDKGNLDGFDVVLGKAVCKEMKVECEFVKVSFSDLFPALKDKKIDIIMSALSITEPRLKEADAGEVYARIGGRFLKLKSKKIEFSADSLKDLKIGLVKRNGFYDYITKGYSTHLEVKEYPDYKPSVEGLLAGEVDLVFSDTVFLDINYVQKPNSLVEFLGPEIQDDKVLGIGRSAYFRKEDAQLRKNFDAAIKKLRGRREFQKISQQYFGRDIFN